MASCSLFVGLKPSAVRRIPLRPAPRASSTACSALHKIAVLPGDGIGPEITAVALSVLKEAGAAEGEEFQYTEALIGGAAIDATGDPYPDETLEVCKASDAVLLAAIGG